MKRTLNLKRETLAELTTDELTAVVGGLDAASAAVTCPVTDCVTAISNAPSCRDCITRACF